MQMYEAIIFGNVSRDFIITPEGEERSVGGAVVYAAGAACALGAQVFAVTKCQPGDRPAVRILEEMGVPLAVRDSAETTSIRNTYHTADRETRTCEAVSMADPYTERDMPQDTDAPLYYLGGLMRGEFPAPFLRLVAERGAVAADAQGFLRVNEGGPMVFRDWQEKRELLPLFHYFKCDAAEGKILTGEGDPYRAAEILATWGPAEVVLTHPEGVIAQVAGETHFAPWTARSMDGRTGRGDTCFCAYCLRRSKHSAGDACRFAAALTSLKMERPGPFAGTVADVEQALAERYA